MKGGYAGTAQRDRLIEALASGEAVVTLRWSRFFEQVYKLKSAVQKGRGSWV
jgi:hypothetical protein